MLPESEQNFINEMIKRVVLAWDPDFTKATEAERKRMDAAENELAGGLKSPAERRQSCRFRRVFSVSNTPLSANFKEALLAIEALFKKCFK